MLRHSFRLFKVSTTSTSTSAANSRSTSMILRLFSSERTSAEISMEKALKTKLKAVHVQVQDVSNGCGSMYNIHVVSSDFQGQTRVKQHRMVNEILKDEIKSMHGLTIRTMTPEHYQKE